MVLIKKKECIQVEEAQCPGKHGIILSNKEVYSYPVARIHEKERSLLDLDSVDLDLESTWLLLRGFQSVLRFPLMSFCLSVSFSVGSSSGLSSLTLSS